MIPTIEIDKEGDIETLYTDDIDLYDLGIVENVRRASNIEFNQIKQAWEVIDAATNKIVHENKNRDDAIAWEINEFSPGGKLSQIGVRS